MNLNEIVVEHRLDPTFTLEFAAVAKDYTMIILYSQVDRNVIERVRIAQNDVGRFVRDVLDAYTELKAA